MKVIAFVAVVAANCRIVEAVPTSSLLHRAASSSGGNPGDIWPDGRALMGTWPDGDTQSDGHTLTDTELAPISSIACLEAKQLNPAVDCSKVLPLRHNSSLNAGNYPSWKEPSCHSDGEYLCDPEQVLSSQERANITALMKRLRKEQYVTCGPQQQHDPVDKWHYQPFYLGVAIAPKDWPMYETDAQSLQMFGRIIAGRWNMTFPWEGNDAFYSRCPTEAMLIIVPEKHQAHLSAPACTFICEEKGGPEVVMAARMGLDRGVAASVEAGVRVVYKAIAKSSPMHAQGWQPGEKTANNTSETGAAGRSDDWEESLWTWAQRVLFAMSVALLIASLVVATLVGYLAPGLAKDLNKSVV